MLFFVFGLTVQSSLTISSSALPVLPLSIGSWKDFPSGDTVFLPLCHTSLTGSFPLLHPPWGLVAWGTWGSHCNNRSRRCQVSWGCMEVACISDTSPSSSSTRGQVRHSYRVTFQGKNGFHSEKLEEGKPRKEELIGGQSQWKRTERGLQSRCKTLILCCHTLT